MLELTLVLATDNVLRYEVVEEGRIGSTIAHLMRESGLADRHNQEILKELRFQFLSPPQGNISLESETGRLYTNGRIDREELCPKRNVCEVLLDIAVQPVTFFQIIKVAINIIDINDNQPVFPEPTFTLSILESAALESTFSLPSARDNDSPAFGVTRYDLVPDSPRSKFSLKVNKKLDGSSDVRLVLKKKLDREQRDLFNLQLVAYDGGISPMTGALNINIHVLDSNDNEPVFSEDSYEVTVLENTTPRTMIVQVQAHDQDDGANGQVVYGFSMQTETNYGHLFGINGESGEVYVRGQIDYEASPIYHLVVTAQDLGPDSLPSDTTVVVHVQDINDNAPQITVNTLTSSAADQAEIAEGSPLGTFVAHVSVKDEDDGANGMVNCSITDQNFALEMRYTLEYQITTAVHLDRELLPEFSISLVIASDRGVPTLTASSEVLITVDDVNDETPEFTEPSYQFSVDENQPPGVRIGSVSAVDND
ncbi:hypothetical protein CAPTEDRAFT_96860, partial [Capitella teleta]